MENESKVTTMSDNITVDTKHLMKMLDCGRKTAVTIGNDANAEIRVGRRQLWSVRKVKEYVDTL